MIFSDAEGTFGQPVRTSGWPSSADTEEGNLVGLASQDPPD